MKICIISDFLPSLHKHWSGAELVAWNTGEMLRRRGHEITYIALSPDKKCGEGGMRFITTPLRNFAFLAKNFPVDIVSFLKILINLKKIKPDVVHIQAKFLFFPAAVSALVLRIPYFFTALDYYNLCPRNILLEKNGDPCRHYQGPHCSDCMMPSEKRSVQFFNLVFPRSFKQVFFLIRKRCIDHFMKKAAKVITFSDASKNRLLAYGYDEGHVQVIYHYVFDEIVPFSQSKDITGTNTILFAGTIAYHKGLHIVVEAMRDVVKEFPDAKLLVAGQGQGTYAASIRSLIDQWGLGRNVDFLGHKTNKEILGLLKKADLVVIPEQWDSEFGPVILIESKLSHRPIVASDIGSIPEYVRGDLDGILVAHNDAHAFAKGIITLFKNTGVRCQMADRVSENIKKISDTENMFGALEKAYAACL